MAALRGRGVFGVCRGWERFARPAHGVDAPAAGPYRGWTGPQPVQGGAVHSDAALWDSAHARRLADRQDVGGLIRLGRRVHGWRQADLGARIGCSASTISRLETHRSPADLELLRQAAHEVGVPPHVLACALGLVASSATTVAAQQQCRPEEDPLRRRTLLTAASLAAPVRLLAGMDEALAVTPDPTGSPVPADVRLGKARRLYDAGRYADLLAALPALLGDLHAQARTGRADLAHARLSSCYTLATSTLSKIGSYSRARLTGDRAATFAELSGSALAQAAAARSLGIVLRHQEQGAAAARLTQSAVDYLEASGLKTEPQRAAYAQLLCTTAYTTARAGRRDEALATLAEAQTAARGLPELAPQGRLFSITPAEVSLYAVGVHWALGDSGSALEAGRSLRAEQFSTVERKGRMHTDLARAWWQWGKPEQTATQLLAAARVCTAEVRDRPAIRKIAQDLVARHPRTVGAQDLAGVLRSA